MLVRGDGTNIVRPAISSFASVRCTVRPKVLRVTTYTYSLSAVHATPIAFSGMQVLVGASQYRPFTQFPLTTSCQPPCRTGFKGVYLDTTNANSESGVYAMYGVFSTTQGCVAVTFAHL